MGVELRSPWNLLCILCTVILLSSKKMKRSYKLHLLLISAAVQSGVFAAPQPRSNGECQRTAVAVLLVSVKFILMTSR